MEIITQKSSFVYDNSPEKNRIEMLKEEGGELISDDATVKKMVVTYWQQLFSEERGNTNVECIAPGSFPLIPQGDMDRLMREYTGTEVQLAIKDMNSFKAPGPDGFQPLFY